MSKSPTKSTEKLNESLTQKLDEIADIILSETIDTENIGLMSGKPGIALFLFYYADDKTKQKFYDKAFELVQEVFDAINDGFTFHTFAGGLAGIGWTISLLAEKDFIDIDAEDSLSELDEYLYNAMMADIRSGNYDFLHGAVGNAIYFLHRLPNPEAENYLTTFIDELESAGQHNADGSIKWESVIDHEAGKKGFNISMSHGIASIVAFLAKVYTTGIAKEKVEKLLNGAVQFLLQQRLDRSKYSSYFPSYALESQDELNSSRLAWCYGDLGISVALWHASRAMKNKAWEDIAVEILKHAAQRRDLQKNGVLDAGLCHGTAGNAQIFYRMYALTGITELKDAGDYWLDQTLIMARFDDGFAGFKAWRTEKYGGWQGEAGLLEGVAGIGLALITALSDIDPAWDECLLLS